jgi:hypothetical protein
MRLDAALNAGSDAGRRGREGSAKDAEKNLKIFLCLLLRPLRFVASGQVPIQELAL